MFVNQNYFCCDVTNFFCYDFLLSIYLVPYIHVYILVLSTLCHFDYSKYTILLGSTAFLILILYDAIVWFFWFTLTFFNWYFLLSFFFKKGGGCVELVAIIWLLYQLFYLYYFSYDHVLMNYYAFSVKLRKYQRSVHDCIWFIHYLFSI